jgi:hypothetical protein
LIQSPGLYSDPSWGILAAEQHLLGKSPGIRSMTFPDAQDLTRDKTAVLTWWSPGYQAIPYAFRSLSLSWGGSIRLTVFLTWLIGAAAWVVYFRIVMPSRKWLPWLALCFFCFPSSHGDASLYTGGERLLWCAVPVVLIQNLLVAATLRRGVLLWALLVGAISCSLFLLKYSAGLLVAGWGCAWLWCMARGHVPRARGVAWWLGVGVTGLVLNQLGFPGGATPGSPSGWSDNPGHILLWVFEAWPLAIVNLGVLDGRYWFGLALLLLLALSWLLARRSPALDDPERSTLPAFGRRFAVCGLGSVCVLLLVIRLRGGDIDDDSRHFRIAVLPLLPFLFSGFVNLARRQEVTAKVVGWACLLVFFAAPALEGAKNGVKAALIRGPRVTGLVSAQGIRLDRLGANADAKSLYEEIRAICGSRATLFYVTSPELGLALAQERLLVVPQFVPPEQLKRARYYGVPAGGVALLLPRHFERNGKASAIRDSFQDVVGWRRAELSHAPEWSLWLGGVSVLAES